MGKYIRTMAESLSMVHEVTNMDLMRKAAGGAMQTLKMKDGKVQMDSFTASAIMQIYDKVNDKNKKTMENMLKTGRRADIMKLQKFAMSKINAEYVPEELDEQLEEKIDPADVDDDATEDDIKSADKNIMMQMRKVQSLRGRYAVEFMDGKKVKVDPKIAMAVQDKYMKMRRPAEKEMFQSKVARSYKDMLSALKESLEEELAKIKGNTPAADGRRAATQDDIDRAEKKGDEKLVKKLKEKPADFIRLTFNSPADVKKAKKWMDQNLPGADQGFTGMDASGKDIEFEDVDDAEDLMDQLKKAGFRFKMDYREEVKIDELSIADVRKGTAKAKKRQGRERKTTGKTSTSTADLAARIKAKEEVELDEAKYDLYHKDFSSAMQHAYAMAKKLHGITIDPKEIDDKVATGPSKPGSGKTNSYRLKGDKGAIQVQVYNKGGSKPFELNMYKEEVELDEGSVEFLDHDASDKDFVAMAKKYKLKIKSDGEDTVATGDPKNIEKLLQNMYGNDWKDMYSVKGGKYTEEEVELGEARQLKDPKKEMMVKSKDSGVIVIDKKDFKKYQKKGYFQVEGFASDAQRRAAFASGYKEKGKKGKKESILDRIDKKLKERKNG